MNLRRLSSEPSQNDFERVRPLLEGARKTTRPKIHDTYDVFCAVLFILKTDSTWRTLPDCYPPWRSVHHHFTVWTASAGSVTVLEEALVVLGLHDIASSLRALISARPAPREWPERFQSIL